MSKNIKGITIEIDGKTDGLDKALNKVNKTAESTATELKQVEKMLKFDPSNVELLAQKQSILNDQIENTSKKLNVLKKAQSQVQAQFDSGKITGDQYRAFQRELIKTESYLESLQNKAKQDVKVNVQADTAGVDKMKAALKELGPAAKNAAKEIGTGIGVAGAAGSAAIGGLVVGMQDLNGDLARLRTNATMAGQDLGLIEDAFKRVVAVTGEADSAVETVSNLLASGFNENQLAQAIEEINGGAVKFSDTLKTEGIADGIQETFASGKSIGMFAELLERSGVDLETFDKGLAKATKSGEGANYILEQLSKLGLAEYSEKYRELNPELTKSAEATVNMQTALAQLAIILTPLTTFVSEFVTKLVEWANKNPELVVSVAALTGILAGVSGVFAALSPIIYSLVTMIPLLTTAFAAISTPVLIVIGALVALGAAFVVLWKQSDTFRTNVTKVFESIKTVATNVFKVVASFIGQKVTEIKDFWDKNGKQILQAAENAFNGILAVINTVMPAIEFVVRFVWEAIKNVINGAISVIMGVIKVFTGLLTGDFSKAWEGVKDIFKGAIDLIMGLMSLSFVGGIRTLVTNLAKTVITTFKTKWTNVVNLFKSGATGVFNAVKSMVTNVISSIKNLATNFVSTIVKMKDNVVSKIQQLVKDIISKFQNMSMVEIGKNIIRGLINGITAMSAKVIEAITGVVDGVINTAKKLLKIASPSKVFEEFGKFIGIGMSDGMSSTQSLNEQVMKKLTDGIVSIKNGTKKDLLKIDADLAKDIADINEKSEERIYKIQQAAKKKKKKLSTDQSRDIQNIRKDRAKKIEELEQKAAENREKITINEQKNEQKLIDDHYKNLLESIKSFIDDKKSLNQMTMIGEAEMWYQSMALFEEGTKERIKAQQEYKKVYDALNKSFIDTNKSFMDEILRIQEETIKQEETLTKEYEDAVKRREQALYGYRGLFDEVEKEVRLVGSKLTKNLENQVAEFDKWKDTIEELSQKAIDEGLLEELREMGPKALDEVIALNKMTEPELQHYSDLYKKKTQQAREQAIKELEWLNVQNKEKITALRADTETKLKTVEEEWMKAVKSITENTDEGFSEMYQIGIDAGQGLSDGLAKMEGPLIKQAKRIANAIKKEIERALDIKSPSRVMEKYGIFIGQGLINGMENMVAKVAKSSVRLADAVTSAHGSLSSSSGKSTSYGASNTTTSNTIDNTKNFSPTVNVYTNENPEKVMRRELKRMAFLF